MILAPTDRRAPHRCDHAETLARFFKEVPMSYASMRIDRRREYYASATDVIAADPISFYARAEKGRRIQHNFPWQAPALPSPPCPGSGRPGVVALDSDEPEWDHPDLYVDYG